MKKIFIFISGAILLFALSFKVSAQTFSVQHDTVAYTWPNTTSLSPINVLDGITNLNTLVSDSVVLSWRIVASDFPSDWVPSTGICDNNLCYTMSSLWPSGSLKNSFKYPLGLGDFHLQTNLTAATTLGTHYVTVKMYNQYNASDSAFETYIITKNAPTGIANVKSSENVLLYPNPAHDELNIVYDAGADVKNIVVYNIIGKMMAVYKVTGNNSANLNLENIPSGIYFVRLVNSHGGMIATRKFTKQ